MTFCERFINTIYIDVLLALSILQTFYFVSLYYLYNNNIYLIIIACIKLLGCILCIALFHLISN